MLQYSSIIALPSILALIVLGLSELSQGMDRYPLYLPIGIAMLCVATIASHDRAKLALNGPAATAVIPRVWEPKLVREPLAILVLLIELLNQFYILMTTFLKKIITKKLYLIAEIINSLYQFFTNAEIRIEVYDELTDLYYQIKQPIVILFKYCNRTNIILVVILEVPLITSIYIIHQYIGILFILMLFIIILIGKIIFTTYQLIYYDVECKGKKDKIYPNVIQTLDQWPIETVNTEQMLLTNAFKSRKDKCKSYYDSAINGINDALSGILTCKTMMHRNSPVYYSSVEEVYYAIGYMYGYNALIRRIALQLDLGYYSDSVIKQILTYCLTNIITFTQAHSKRLESYPPGIYNLRSACIDVLKTFWKEPNYRDIYNVRYLQIIGCPWNYASSFVNFYFRFPDQQLIIHPFIEFYVTTTNKWIMKRIKTKEYHNIYHLFKRLGCIYNLKISCDFVDDDAEGEDFECKGKNKIAGILKYCTIEETDDYNEIKKKKDKYLKLLSEVKPNDKPDFARFILYNKENFDEEYQDCSNTKLPIKIAFNHNQEIPLTTKVMSLASIIWLLLLLYVIYQSKYYRKLEVATLIYLGVIILIRLIDVKFPDLLYDISSILSGPLTGLYYAMKLLKYITGAIFIVYLTTFTIGLTTKICPKCHHHISGPHLCQREIVNLQQLINTTILVPQTKQYCFIGSLFSRVYPEETARVNYIGDGYYLPINDIGTLILLEDLVSKQVCEFPKSYYTKDLVEWALKYFKVNIKIFNISKRIIKSYFYYNNQEFTVNLANFVQENQFHTCAFINCKVIKKCKKLVKQQNAPSLSSVVSEDVMKGAMAIMNHNMEAFQEFLHKDDNEKQHLPVVSPTVKEIVDTLSKGKNKTKFYNDCLDEFYQLKDNNKKEQPRKQYTNKNRRNKPNKKNSGNKINDIFAQLQPSIKENKKVIDLSNLSTTEIKRELNKLPEQSQQISDDEQDIKVEDKPTPELDKIKSLLDKEILIDQQTKAQKEDNKINKIMYDGKEQFCGTQTLGKFSIEPYTLEELCTAATNNLVKYCPNITVKQFGDWLVNTTEQIQNYNYTVNSSSQETQSTTTTSQESTIEEIEETESVEDEDEPEDFIEEPYDGKIKTSLPTPHNVIKLVSEYRYLVNWIKTTLKVFDKWLHKYVLPKTHYTYIDIYILPFLNGMYRVIELIEKIQSKNNTYFAAFDSFFSYTYSFEQGENCLYFDPSKVDMEIAKQLKEFLHIGVAATEVKTRLYLFFNKKRVDTNFMLSWQVAQAMFNDEYYSMNYFPAGLTHQQSQIVTKLSGREQTYGPNFPLNKGKHTISVIPKFCYKNEPVDPACKLPMTLNMNPNVLCENNPVYIYVLGSENEQIFKKHYPRKCAHNSLAALTNRLYKFFGPKINNPDFDVDEWVDEFFENWEKCTDVDHYHWVNMSFDHIVNKHGGRKGNMYNTAAKECTWSSKCKLLIKNEPLKEKDFDGIQRPDKCRAIVSSNKLLTIVFHLIHTYTETLFLSESFCAKGLSNYNKAEQLYKLSRGYKYYFCTDGTRFDAHVNRKLVTWEQIVVNEISRRCSGLTFDFDDFERKTLVNNDVKIKLPKSGRKSGDPWTAFFNCLINCSMGMFFQARYDIKFINDGDDMVWFVNDKQIIDKIIDKYKSIGIEVRVDKVTEDFTDIEFCQCKPSMGSQGWMLVRNPMKVIQSLCYCREKPYSKQWYIIMCAKLVCCLQQFSCHKSIREVAVHFINKHNEILTKYLIKHKINMLDLLWMNGYGVDPSVFKTDFVEEAGNEIFTLWYEVDVCLYNRAVCSLRVCLWRKCAIERPKLYEETLLPVAKTSILDLLLHIWRHPTFEDKPPKHMEPLLLSP